MPARKYAENPGLELLGADRLPETRACPTLLPDLSEVEQIDPQIVINQGPINFFQAF